MDVSVLYNPHVEMPLGVPIALYFYLTGLSAGSFVISVVATIGGRVEYKPVGKIGAALAPILLCIAPLILIVDLEQPFRFWHLFYYLNPHSPITYGSFLLTAYPINGVFYAWYTFKNQIRPAKVLGIIGIPLAIATHGYTGFILALGKGRALWSTALMPTLFIVSAMVSGFALMVLAAIIKHRFFAGDLDAEGRAKEKEIVFGLAKFMGAMILFDLFLILNDILVLLTSTQEAHYVAQLILFGHFAKEFVGIEIVMGGLVPLAIIFGPWTKRSVAWMSLASVLTLIGIMAMRYTVVIAGQSVPLH
jgi:tetrathionate reductase subunit C